MVLELLLLMKNKVFFVWFQSGPSGSMSTHRGRGQQCGRQGHCPGELERGLQGRDGPYRLARQPGGFPTISQAQETSQIWPVLGLLGSDLHL